jgi:hypothetical protein
MPINVGDIDGDGLNNPVSAETDSPSTQLRTIEPDVAECIREARERLSAAGPSMNAMGVGDRSVRLQAALSPVRDAITAATLADLGYSLDGPNQPPEAARVTARNLAALDVLGETFWTWIEAQGVLTAKGKTRAAVTTWLSIVDRQTKLAGVLGLERKARAATPLADVLAQHEESIDG